MPKALRFKGDKKPKKRKRAAAEGADFGDDASARELPPTKKTVVKKAYESDDEGWIDSEALGVYPPPPPRSPAMAMRLLTYKQRGSHGPAHFLHRDDTSERALLRRDRRRLRLAAVRDRGREPLHRRADAGAAGLGVH